MATLAVNRLIKKFGSTVAVDDVTLEFPDGKLTVLVGPSGCGKTTLLRILAGLEEPTEGHVLVDGKEVTAVPPWDRNVAMVFQSYALYPHMTVFKNMAFPLEAKKTPRSEIKRRVEAAAESIGIEKLLHRYPRELSGGQMQRVALGRAIVRKPEVFLMDEPLSNLDAQLRVYMRAELKRLQKDLGVTSIYVTHDQAEAMTMADQLVVMNRGKVLQVGQPDDVYRYPDEVFVAGFIGSPGMNILPGRLSADRSSFAGPKAHYPLPAEAREALRAVPADRDVALGIRPEDIAVDLRPSPEAVEASVYVTEALGKETLLTLKCGDSLIKACAPATLRLDIGAAVWIHFDPGALRVFNVETGRKLYPDKLEAGRDAVQTNMPELAMAA
jgi:multiple sugar transport system ATP-binding protein